MLADRLKEFGDIRIIKNSPTSVIGIFESLEGSEI